MTRSTRLEPSNRPRLRSGRKSEPGSFWFYGNCLYRDGHFTHYVLKNHGGPWWSLILPDGTETPQGTRGEAEDVAVSLASGMRPSSNRVHPGE